jgi:hypothetical protein
MVANGARYRKPSAAAAEALRPLALGRKLAGRFHCSVAVRLVKAVLVFWAALAGTVPAMGGAAPFTFGVFPRWNAQITVRDFGPLARELGSALGEPLRVETDKDFPSFMARV